MSTPLSTLALAQLDQTYRALDIILGKAETHAGDAGVDESVYLGWRLAANMYPLVKQVQLVSDFSVRGLCRLAGADPVSMPDDETSFAALRARIARAREAVWALDKAAIDADPDGTVTFPAGPGREMTLPRRTYLQNFVFANVMFHTSIAYGILRQIGVPLGKTDILAVQGS